MEMHGDSPYLSSFSLTPELAKFSSRASLTWHARFVQSASIYCRSQLYSLQPFDTFQDDQNALERYTSIRRGTTGAHMAFDLVELALGHKPLEDTEVDDGNVHARVVMVHTFDALRDLAADIVALSSVRVHRINYQYPTNRS